MTEVEVFQPPQKGHRCKNPECNAKLCHVNTSGLCRRCYMKQVGAKNLYVGNRKRRDAKK